MWEYTPPGSWARMTATQVKAYIKDLEEKRRIAKQKLEKARKDWDLEVDPSELEALEKALDDI